MQIHIQEEPGLAETEVVIRCPRTDGQVARMLALLRVFEQKLTGVRDGETFLLEAAEVLYIDTVDRRTFLYTSGGVYETPLKLYELSDRLASVDFFRAGKSELGGRMRLTMSNGELVFVSRQYVPEVKRRLGLL